MGTLKQKQKYTVHGSSLETYNQARLVIPTTVSYGINLQNEYNWEQENKMMENCCDFKIETRSKFLMADLNAPPMECQLYNDSNCLQG